MKKELAIKQIYDDFRSKVELTDDEIDVLKHYIKGCSLIQISYLTNMSDRNVSRVINRIKEKYERYKQLEIARLKIFMS